MRDMVEIGMGRTARRTYELGDINIVPSRRTRSSKDVSTAWQLDAYRFDMPVLSHPTDALASTDFAIELGRLGGLGVLNGEGLIGRHADVEEKIAQVLEAAEKEPEPSAAIRERVSAARGRQRSRQSGTYAACNAQMSPAELRRLCRLDGAARRALADAHDRAMRVARTLADLDGCDTVQRRHVAQAVAYRAPGRDSAAVEGAAA